MKKVELCTASTGVTSCENSVVIGETEKTVDIASVDKGFEAYHHFLLINSSR